MLKILRPAIALSPEMTSHAVSLSQFRKVQQIYADLCNRRSQHIITDYFDSDIICSFAENHTGRTMQVKIVNQIDRRHLEEYNLELVNQQHIILPLTNFKSKLIFHHERQRVELRYYGPTSEPWIMIMQVLLVGLVDPKTLNITQIIKNLGTDQSKEIISMSYFLDVTNIKDLDRHLGRMSH
jgi:hypothetical protein